MLLALPDKVRFLKIVLFDIYFIIYYRPPWTSPELRILIIFSCLGSDNLQHSPVSSLMRLDRREFFKTPSSSSDCDEAGRRTFDSSPSSGLMTLSS
jgi:hypothetical protein